MQDAEHRDVQDKAEKTEGANAEVKVEKDSAADDAAVDTESETAGVETPDVEDSEAPKGEGAANANAVTKGEEDAGADAANADAEGAEALSGTDAEKADAEDSATPDGADAEDATACAEALESLDSVSPILPEPELESGAAGEPAQPTGADPSGETISLADLPHDESLTRELPGLGSAPRVDGTVAMSDLPLPSAPTAREAEERRRKANPRRRRALIVAGLVVALAACGGGYAAWNAYSQEQQTVAKANAHTMMSVTIGVRAAGLDTSTGSKIPVEISGQDADGSAVSLTAYVDEKGRGIKLMPGDYTFTVAASPIAADGTIYTVPTKKAQVTVESDGQDLSSVCTFKLKVPSADTVTDEAIAAAGKYAEEGGCNSAAVAKILERAATARRDAAANAVSSREAQVERDADARHKATNLYALDIPVEWYGKVSTWQNGNTLCIYLANDPDTPLVTLVAVKTGESFTPDDGDTVLGTVDLGNGYTVYASGPAYPYVVAQTINGRTENPVDTYSMDAATELVELTTGNRYTYNQIKNDLVGKKGDATAATKLETDYLAQILLPSIKAES